MDQVQYLPTAKLNVLFEKLISRSVRLHLPEFDNGLTMRLLSVVAEIRDGRN